MNKNIRATTHRLLAVPERTVREGMRYQTGKAYCKPKIQFAVDRLMMYERMSPLVTSLPKAGTVEFAINKDQTNSGKLVVWRSNTVSVNMQSIPMLLNLK